MRFFLASLLLAAAALVSADSGDKIGTVHHDQECASEGIDLIDNQCTSYSQGSSINLTADAAICYSFLDGECNQVTTPDGVKFEKGCEPTEKLDRSADFLICYGESRSGGGFM